jgi:RND family efflux transporter MFP subunit
MLTQLTFRLVNLFLLMSLFLGGCSDERMPEKSVVRPVKAMIVGDVNQLTSRAFPGRAKATREVDLAFRVAGPLITRPVNVGDEVEEGDVVARIDPRDFEVALRNAQGQLQEAKAALIRAESDYARLTRIYKQDPGATSETAIDQARQNRDGARANVTSLEASVASAKDQLSYTYLKAPFSGTVVATYVQNFENVRAREAIIRLVDRSKIEMIVNIPETLISLASEIRNIRVTFDPFPDREIPAKIKEIGKEASETTRTYPVTLIMDQPADIKILPGMAGKSTADPPSDSAEAAAIEIPVAATFSPSGSDKTFVWVIDKQTMRVNQKEVSTGELTAHGIRIVSGLAPGALIATAGVNYLHEGQQVRILQD